MNGLRKKCQKPPFLGILGQNGPFWTVFGQNGQNENFSKKALGKFFLALTIPNYKVSEKVMNGYRETASQTDGRA